MALPDADDIARMRRIIARLISYGVEVREMPGHETRGFRFTVIPSRVVDHHDASSLKSGEWGALGLCLDGTPRGIPGPLCNVLVARCLDGRPRVAIVADGYAYHAGLGGPYAELPLNDANPRTYGVEKANDGLGEPYSAAANYATNALFHAMAVESGRIPESFPIGHKEWAPGRKSDPLYSMADRRRQVAAFTPTGPSGPTSQEEEDEMPTLIYIDTGGTWLRDGAGYDWISDPRTVSAYIEAGAKSVKITRAEHDNFVNSQAARTAKASIDSTAIANAVAAALTQALKASPPVGGGSLDPVAFAKAMHDEADRRIRDGNPATGPAS